MSEALEEAKKAAALGEIPIGAVIVRDGEVIARGHNLTETTKDPTAHAEIGCEMYVTIEPCSMCAGALVWARIEKLHIGAMDPKAGACGSVFNIPGSGRLNHTIEMEYGIMADECAGIVKDFFRELRLRTYGRRMDR